MNETKVQEYKSSLLGKYVKFKINGKQYHFGRVTSVEHDIANIRGIEQRGNGRPQYHYNFQEITVCSHDEVFKLGRAAINLFK